MSTTFEHLLEHKAATDATDRQLVYILCKFIDKLDDDGNLPHTDNLFEFVADELSELPGSLIPGCNHYNDSRFTDKDRDTIINMVMGEIADCSLKDLAHDQIAGEPLVELISYACDDPELLAQLLMGEDGSADGLTDDQINELHAFAMRMGLINDTEEVTKLGQAFIERNA